MKQVNQIIEIISDTSFPQIVLLDGPWGCGKTYFITHHLTSALKSKFGQEVYFFSLYGISNIDEFRDRIISLSITEKEGMTVLAKHANKIADGIANFVGEKGIGAIISGAAGAYKYQLYNNFDNCILILDDLERVSDEKLIKNILGECLSLAETKNIKIVVVANENKLTCKDDIEKVFADKYKFSFTHEEVVDILRRKYNTLDDQLANELFLNVTSIDSKNIRVLKRALAKFVRVKGEVEKVSNVILDEALSRLLSDIIRLCYAKFELGYTKEKIIKANETRGVRNLIKAHNGEENKEYEQLDKIFNNSYYASNVKLVNYCCDGVFDFDNLNNELNLPTRRSLLDSMRSSWTQNQLADDEFKEGVRLLEGFIEKATGIQVIDWFVACDNYINLLDSKAIPPNKYSKEALIRLCSNVDMERFLTTDIQDKFNDVRNISFHNQMVEKQFYLYKNNLERLAKENKSSDFSKRFKESWSTVKNEVLQNMMHSPIYQDLNVELIQDSLLSWSNDDVFQFVRFNVHRYQFSNIEDFFEPEIEALKEIAKMLLSLKESIGFGLKVASVSELHECFSDAYTRMETNLAKKANSTKNDN
ncbi:P-loop NTPase fold protein [Aeromonas veronii]|uniref:P-loop NTPase fold protein n=1 Tax=Aeromonas veronii TaxID=654 RepID=UPI0013DF2187|nr:P-loop NTPase fold protein [Aeromonas veronii]QIF44531.1 NTPase [Aeromonas veronii]